MPQLATAGQRIVAWIIDMIVIALIVIVLGAFGFGGGLLLRGLTIGMFTRLLVASTIVLIFAVVVLYTLLLEGLWNGQTVGKRIVSIKTVQENGRPITLLQSAARNILRVLDNQFIGLIGLILILVTKRRQRIGDLVARTVVVKA